MGTGPSDNLLAHKAISLCEDLSSSEKRVAAAIIDHYNRKTGQCDPGLGRIARLIGVSRRTVIRAVGALAKKGYIRKHRHGGNYHRNQYEPDWTHFRAMEAKWKARKSGAGRKPVATDVSPSERQGCHVGDDTSVTQTLPRNSLKETLAAANSGVQPRTSSVLATSEGLGNEANRKASYPIVQQRFHVKSASPCVAANDAAERRWADQLTRQFASTPEVFAVLIDAIDDDLRNATTQVEFRNPGSGIAFLLAELDKRLTLHSHRGSSET